MNKKIENLKSHITSTFIKTQKLITSSYFDNVFDSITDLEGVENIGKNFIILKII